MQIGASGTFSKVGQGCRGFASDFLRVTVAIDDSHTTRLILPFFTLIFLPDGRQTLRH